MATRETSSTASPAGHSKNPTVSELQQRQNDYLTLRRNVALGMLVVAPALIALPPRKLDLFTFGLGFTWVFCLNEVMKPSGTDIFHALAGRPQKAADATAAEEENKLGGWKGTPVFEQFRQKEEEGKGIGEMITESVWEVWQQRDKRNLTPEQEEEEDLPLAERFKKYEAEKKKKEQMKRDAIGSVTERK
ncbi:hypothetical protein FN846DRAFT_909380 [Sphaerosporella brunnea]|uniref:Uncharacterized protein n=1 Tax=Sphaerosporella brunnea TaxID=1250544 RepID=A0A5J5EQ02_9PEZI|nr:hypothetical protein FN846DRAFT_909380 [Sphaerosporella brunnea]